MGLQIGSKVGVGFGKSSRLGAATPVLTATANGSHEIDLLWTGNDISILERSLDNATWTLVGKFARGTNSYNNTGLALGTKYYYRVRTFDGISYTSYGTDDATTTGSLPSYSNPLGSGDRTALMTASTNILLVGGTAAKLINGVKTGEGMYFDRVDGQNQITAGKYFAFDLGTSYIITEAKYYTDVSLNLGDWKWQGSANGSDWVDIGNAFAIEGWLGSPYIYTLTELSGNTTGYRYYRMLGLSGSLNDYSWPIEFEFKIGDT